MHIKKAGYIPKAYTDQEDDQNFIRRSLTEVFLGQRSIPLNIVSLPVDQDAIEVQKQLQTELSAFYRSGKPFPVKMVE